MYIEHVPNRNSPPAVLLRESYRDEDGKVRKRTIANLTSLKPKVIAGLKALLKGGNASELPLADQFEVERTLPHGHVAAALGLFGRLGMFSLLERKASQERSLAAALIVSRLLDPGSKLAVARQLNRESATHTLAEELGLDEKIGEKDLYGAMSWLAKRQDKIERRLADKYLGDGRPVLYDLFSTYYEGSTCVLARRGYSRDGKKGTRQINFGLLCSQEGCPVAVEVFPGHAHRRPHRGPAPVRRHRLDQRPAKHRRAQARRGRCRADGLVRPTRSRRDQLSGRVPRRAAGRVHKS